MSNRYTNDLEDLYPISSYLIHSNVSDLRLHTISRIVMITNSFKIAHNPKCQQLSLYKTSLSRLIRQYGREYLKKQNTLVTIYWYVEKNSSYSITCKTLVPLKCIITVIYIILNPTMIMEIE